MKDRSIREVLAEYERGVLLRIEALGMMTSTATAEDLAWLQAEHPEWLQHLLEKVEQYPDDDDEEGWGQVIEIDGGACWSSMEALQKWRDGFPDRLAQTRRGIKLIREFTNPS